MTLPSDSTAAPTLPQLLQASLAQLMRLNSTMDALVTLMQANAKNVEEIKDTLNGFTSGGASFGAYQTDPFTTAYLSILGPMLAFRLGGELQNKLIPELLKAGAPLARDVLEELAAYRQQQLGRDTLENMVGAVRDPWADKVAPESDSWDALGGGPVHPDDFL